MANIIKAVRTPYTPLTGPEDPYAAWHHDAIA